MEIRLEWETLLAPGGIQQQPDYNDFLDFFTSEYHSLFQLPQHSSLSTVNQRRAGVQTSSQLEEWEQFVDYDWQMGCSGIFSSGQGSSLTNDASVAQTSQWPIDDESLQSLESLPSDWSNSSGQLYLTRNEVVDVDSGPRSLTQHSASSSSDLSSFTGNCGPITTEYSHSDSEETSLDSFADSELTPDYQSISTSTTPISTHSAPFPQTHHSRLAVPLEHHALYTCRSCHRRFLTRGRRDVHESSHPRFMCTVKACSKSTHPFRTLRDFERHNQSVHGASIVLPCNKRLTRRKDNILRHQRSCRVCAADRATVMQVIAAVTTGEGVT
jgi:hypothetical protein